MKKITFKITAFLIFSLFAFQTQAQSAWAGTVGVYKIKVDSQDLYLTTNATTGVVTYEALLPGDDTSQLFAIDNHPAGTHFSFTSQNGKGVVELVPADGSDVTPDFICQGNSAVASGQQDQLNPTRGSGTQIFLESDKTGTPWAALGAKRRVQTAVLGGVVSMSGGTAVTFGYVFVSALSNDKIDSSSIFVSNPVNNEFVVKGLSGVNTINVYSLLGAKVLSSQVSQEAITVDVSALSAGMYVVEVSGANGVYTQKIVK